MSVLNQVFAPDISKMFVRQLNGLLRSNFNNDNDSLHPEAKELVRASLKGISTGKIQNLIIWLSQIIGARTLERITETKELDIYQGLQSSYNPESAQFGIVDETISLQDGTDLENVDKDQFLRLVRNSELKSLTVDIDTPSSNNYNVGFDFNQTGDIESVSVIKQDLPHRAHNVSLAIQDEETQKFFKNLWQDILTSFGYTT